MHSRFTTSTMISNPAQPTSSLLENVSSLEYAVRLHRSKLTILWMKQSTQAKELIPQSACFTITWRIIQWVKKILRFIGTIVQAKTKIMPLYSTCCGMLCLVGTSLLNSHLWLLAILNCSTVGVCNGASRPSKLFSCDSYYHR